MVNYTNGKIYKIQKIGGEGLSYVGATTNNYLCQRFEKHKYDYKRWKAGLFNKITVFEIFDKYGIENCSITLLEPVDCKTKDELTAREAHYIRSEKCVNKKIEGRTKKQYYIDHRDKIIKKQKLYYIDHKDERLDYQRKYYGKIRLLTCEVCGNINEEQTLDI